VGRVKREEERVKREGEGERGKGKIGIFYFIKNTLNRDENGRNSAIAFEKFCASGKFRVSKENLNRDYKI
jgi:hypothetical protein